MTLCLWSVKHWRCREHNGGFSPLCCFFGQKQHNRITFNVSFLTHGLSVSGTVTMNCRSRKVSNRRKTIFTCSKTSYVRPTVSWRASCLFIHFSAALGNTEDCKQREPQPSPSIFRGRRIQVDSGNHSMQDRTEDFLDSNRLPNSRCAQEDSSVYWVSVMKYSVSHTERDLLRQ